MNDTKQSSQLGLYTLLSIGLLTFSSAAFASTPQPEIPALQEGTAEAQPAENMLADKSPFLPPGYGKKKSNTRSTTPKPKGQPLSKLVQFRGIFKMGDNYQFSIYNNKEKKSYWLTEDQANDAGISVTAFDAENSTIMINMNGQTERLTLQKPSNKPIKIAGNSNARPTKATRNTPIPQQLKVKKKLNSKTNVKTPNRRQVILPNRNK